MSNYLPLNTRARIVNLAAQGATLREIAAQVGVQRQTAATAIERIAAERLMLAGIAQALVELAIELHASLAWSCPLHPNAGAADFAEDGSGCLLCSSTAARRTNGLRRHHARRKAEGRPILPPWQRKRQ